MGDYTLAGFLNSTFQSSNGIGRSSLKSLLDGKESHQAQLDRTLFDAKQSTQTVLADLLSKSTAQKNDLDNFHSSLEQTKSAFDTCAGAATSTQVPFLDQLSTLEQKLTTLDNAKQYMKTLLVASDLEERTRTLVKDDPAKSIEPYQQLVRLISSIRSCISDRTAETQFSALISHLDRTSAKLYRELYDVMSSDFRISLEALKWPAPNKTPYGPELKTKIDSFAVAFRNLLLLTSPQDTDKKLDPRTISLPPITIMLEALDVRFRFHFESSKPTNRLDKPEWYLSQAKSTIASHVPFLISTIQPIVEKNLDSDVSAKDCFIRGLLENVTRKLRSTVPKMTSKPHLLSHTIHEVLKFDDVLRYDFAYCPTEGCAIGDLILGNDIWFKTWFEAEKGFAQKRYDEIATDSEAFEPYETENELGFGAAVDTVKATKSSAKLIHLLESITESYKLIPNIDKKLRFFMGIQLGLLNQYNGRITSALDAFEALSLIRSVPVPGGLPESVTGVAASSETSGSFASLRRLCRWWASARSICDTLRELADDDFFLALQFEMRNETNLVTQVVTELKSMDSALAFLDVAAAGDIPLFAQALGVFEHLVQRTERLMVKVVMKEWATDARMYARRWQLTEDNGGEGDELSVELYLPLHNFRLSCSYLASNLPAADFANVYRMISMEIEDWHMRNVIAPNQLTRLALGRLANDLEQGLWSVGRRWLTKPENYMRKLKAEISIS